MGNGKSLVTKKFDKLLYDKNDSLAKNIILSLVKKYDNEDGQINSDKYGPDLVFKDYYGECEIKYNWKGKIFPFDTIQFPYRKKKFINLDKPTTFFMLNADQSYVLIVYDQDLLDSPVEIVKNKYVMDNEKFFQVPIIKAQLVEIKESK